MADESINPQSNKTRSFQVTNLLSTLPAQYLDNNKRKGFNFNILIIGDKEIGKSTLLKCLFNEKFLYKKLPEDSTREHDFDINSETFILKKNNVTLNLTVHEAQNYNQKLDNKVEDSIQPLVEFLESKLYAYFNEESKPFRTSSQGYLVHEKVRAKIENYREVLNRETELLFWFYDT